MISLPSRSPVLPWRLPTPDAETTDGAYAETLRRIYAYSEVRRTHEEIAVARARKLERIRGLLGMIGTPQAHYRTVLVAGTKGKGSTAACLASILEVAGCRVGLYTQPHLYSFRERTWARGRHIAEDEVVAGFAEIEPSLDVLGNRARDLGRFTSFDVGTALALLHFARAEVDVAIVEVGVGGANDATNVLEPVLSLIGPVGLDHKDTLGESVDDIAREKAGVARRGIEVLVGRQDDGPRRVIRAAVGSVGGRCREIGFDFGWEIEDSPRMAFSVWGCGEPIEGLWTPLAGPCQRDNATMAVAAARWFADSGDEVDPSAIRRGLSQLQWPGRFQRVLDEPLTVVDGAHNAAAAGALAATVRECFPGRPIGLVLGMSAEKDPLAFIDGLVTEELAKDELAMLTTNVFVTRARHARSFDPEVLAAYLARRNIRATVCPRPIDALRLAWQSVPDGGVTLVTGSLFLIGDVLELLLPLANGSEPCL